MPYTFVTDSFHTEKLCSRLSSENDHFAFLSPLWGLRGIRVQWSS